MASESYCLELFRSNVISAVTACAIHLNESKTRSDGSRGMAARLRIKSGYRRFVRYWCGADIAGRLADYGWEFQCRGSRSGIPLNVSPG